MPDYLDPLTFLKEEALTFVFVFFLLFAAGFAASSETAFFSLNRFQLRRIRERFRPSYERIKMLLGRPSRLLILILLINECVNLTISSLIADLFHRHTNIPSERWYVLVIASTSVSLPLILVFGEVTPKILAARMNRIIAIFNSGPLSFLYYLFFPFVWFFDKGVNSLLSKLKTAGKDPLSKTMSVLSEEDFLLLMDEGHREGTIYSEEKKLIQRVLDFDDSTVDEVMTPIQEAFCIPDTAMLSEFLPEIKAQKYSRIPVFHKTKKNIVGVLYVKDLLQIAKDADLSGLDIKSVMTPVSMFVSEAMRLSALFRKFKEEKTHMAFCTDEANQTLGVVTMEDVLENIFGEIEDERDIKK
ncbi:MAG: hemolysin family protein [Bacteriovoracia bacterium]